MSRPLMQYGVGQLEEMFANGRTDPKVLKRLENELQFRQVPRAVSLLAEVQAAKHGATPAAQPSPPPAPRQTQPGAPEQPNLWEAAAPPTASVASPKVSPLRQAPQLGTKEPAEKSSSAQPPAQVMPLEDAYKLLKATASSTWESIEQTRRQLVQLSSPGRLMALNPEKRSQALVEAKQINAAYAAISQARCGGH